MVGRYGDQIEEMSWAVNETLHTLRTLGLEKDTLVFFVSDHGPHREMCADGGEIGPFRGRYPIIRVLANISKPSLRNPLFFIGQFI